MSSSSSSLYEIVIHRPRSSTVQQSNKTVQTKSRRAFEQFPCLASVSSDLQDEDLALYGEYMENTHENMQIRFSDLLMMVIPTWVSILFELNVADIDISLQEPLIELQSDEIMRAKFRDGKYNVWKTNDVATKYPLLWDRAQIYVITFPTSYLFESGFSRLSQLLSKARNRLNIVKRGDLRLSLTSMGPDIKKLAEQYQPKGSH
ncbi:SCAN domain-containing protein 3-like [Palaemon carinicauda]|uniref:SCAN domain-containing protein 3-like n=1 Tax=Palaemon carinicauda TaxID=392227 RepID=UPI0035B661F7